MLVIMEPGWGYMVVNGCKFSIIKRNQIVFYRHSRWLYGIKNKYPCHSTLSLSLQSWQENEIMRGKNDIKLLNGQIDSTSKYNSSRKKLTLLDLCDSCRNYVYANKKRSSPGYVYACFEFSQLV